MMELRVVLQIRYSYYLVYMVTYMRRVQFHSGESIILYDSSQFSSLKGLKCLKTTSVFENFLGGSHTPLAEKRYSAPFAHTRLALPLENLWTQL